MLEANEKIQLQTLTERDVRIDVIMGDIGTSDFDRVPETIPLGEKAARAAASRLAALAVPEPEYLAWRARVDTAQTVETRIADVKFEGLSRVNPEYLRGPHEHQGRRPCGHRGDQQGCEANVGT